MQSNEDMKQHPGHGRILFRFAPAHEVGLQEFMYGMVENPIADPHLVFASTETTQEVLR